MSNEISQMCDLGYHERCPYKGQKECACACHMEKGKNATDKWVEYLKSLFEVRMNPFMLDLASGLLCLALSGCGNTVNVPAVPSTSTVPVPAGQTSAPAPTDTTSDNTDNSGNSNNNTQNTNSSVSVQLTLYTYTKVIATVNGVTQIHATANCVQYQSKDYCWDDGIKSGNNFASMTYWGIDSTPIACPNIHGGCASDYFVSPKQVTQNIVNVLNTVSGSAHRTVSEVYQNGSSQAYNCVDDNQGNVDCGDFSFDTN